ncbi:MAG: DUF1285 domain-containing protein [Acetobacteraceae bacterium]|nr:DUF1285 domain-containing protein [Acetobacteraceae bacterium]
MEPPDEIGDGVIDATSPLPLSPGALDTSAAGAGGLTLGRPGFAEKGRVPFEWGELPFLIRRDGTWLYRGSPIQRKELVCLFASILRRDAEGAWRLETPAERGRIEVEDAPFVAVELDWAGEGRHQVLSFRTNTDQVVTAGSDHPMRVSHDMLTSEPTPYILLRQGDGAHAIEARVNRAVYYELVALAVPEYVGAHLMLGVWSSGIFFPLGFMPDEDGEDEL